MNIAEFRRRSDDALLRRGLTKLKINRGRKTSDAFSVYAADGDTIVRCFAPAALRRPWGCQMMGAFYIHIPELRNWLISKDQGVPDATLGYLMSNEFQFVAPVSVGTEDDWPSIEPWFDAICARVLSLPSSFDELTASVSNPSRYLRLLVESQPAFWDSFNRWQNSK